MDWMTAALSSGTMVMALAEAGAGAAAGKLTSASSETSADRAKRNERKNDPG